MTASSPNDAVLTIASLSAGYGRYDVVRDIDLHVGEGEAVALLGPNGAGKTTVLRAIMGLIKHRRGTIRVRDTDVSRLAAHKIARGHAALVPEGRRLFSNQSVEDNLSLGALHMRHDHERVQRLLRSVYDLFPILEEYRKRSSAALSGGQQQMVAIGRMMMSDPDIMLLDEPSLGLAPLAIDAVANALLDLRAQQRSLLIVEQRVDLALRVCDRVYVLAGGEVAMEERAAALDPQERALINAYLG